MSNPNVESIGWQQTPFLIDGDSPDVGWEVKIKDPFNASGASMVSSVDSKIETRGVSYWIRQCYANGGGTIAVQITANNGQSFWLFGVSQ